ncbi:MAG: type I-U CRISPR-associated protein Cas8c [Kofleriaceae bacterium]
MITKEEAVAEASIPVDILNPGQVFACLGLVEAAEALLGDAEGAFDWTEPARVRFWLRARGDASPVVQVLEFLANAEVRGEMPADSGLGSAWKSAWGTLESRSPDDPYPFPTPQSPQMVVCILRHGGRVLAIDYWGDEGRDNFKLWAGSAGYPGAALVRDALDLVRARAVASAEDPFSVGAPQSSSFRLDWRRDYIPIDAGFSLNAHGGRIEAVGFPLVEVLGAVGLTHARPRRVTRRDKLLYRYGIAGRSHDDSLWLSPSLLRAALGVAPLPFPTRRFRMHLGWPGKEGQARAITTVIEETQS